MTGLESPVPYLLRDGAAESTGSILHTPFTVGRSPDRDVVLTHPFVSRQHAAIVLEQDGYYVEDHGSRHGTFVNGERITRHRLAPEQAIHFGAPDGPMLRFGERAEAGSSTLHDILGQIPAIQASSGLEKLRWFFESARKLNTYGAVDQILAVLLETTLQLTRVERGYVFLRNQSGALDLAAGRSSTGDTLVDDGTLSLSAIEKARTTANEYIVTDTFSEGAMARSESIVAHNIRSVICIPLRSRRRHGGSGGDHAEARAVEDRAEVMGLLYLDSRLTAGRLTEIDSDLLRTIATEAAALIDNAQLAVAEESERRYREEMNIAAEIQQGLMAVQLPTLSYASICARSVACKEVGGDFYDVVVDADSVALVIADVSGKGISAAILASTLQGMIYAQLLAGQPLDRVAEVANRYICSRKISKYATLAILRLARGGALEYINCGHIAPLVCGPGGAEELPETNLPVGLIPEATFTSAVTVLQPGSRVLLMTDGVTEAEDTSGEFFGPERLGEAVQEGATLEQVFARMEAFCGGVALTDDCTMIEVHYRGIELASQG